MHTVEFEHAIGDKVRIKISGEEGAIRSLCIDHTADKQAFVLYKANDGRAVTGWWSFDVIEPA
jgi:hypothetical protein